MKQTCIRIQVGNGIPNIPVPQLFATHLPTANFWGVTGQCPLPENDYHMVNDSRDPSSIKKTLG